MSGSLSSIEYIDNGQTVSHDNEAAGYIAAAVVAIVKAISPFVVAAVKGALVGSVVSAGIAYAGGARGADVWRAAGYGAIGGAITGGIGHALSGAASGTTTAAATTAPTTASTTAAVPGAVPGGAVGSATSGVSGVVSGAGGSVVSPTMTASIQRFFGSALSNQTIQRMGAALINAAVNGQSMGRMDSLVAQQKAELDRMTAGQRNEYLARAQETLAEADRNDPQWRARLAMADVQGSMTRQHDQALREINTKEGGSFDAGQEKAYRRGAALRIARDKSLAYNRAFSDAEVARQQIKAQGMGYLGNAFAQGLQGWQAGLGLDVSQLNNRRALDQSTWGAFADAGFGSGQTHTPGASPDPSDDEEEDQNTFTGRI